MLLIMAPVLVSNGAASEPVDKQYARVPLFEFFTAVWCSSCFFGDQALDEMHEEYGQQLAILEYHPGFWEGDGNATPWAFNGNGWSEDDPFGTTEIDARYDHYWPDRSTFGFPSAVVNGDQGSLVERIGGVQFAGQWVGDVQQTRRIYEAQLKRYSDTTVYGLDLDPLELDEDELTISLSAHLPARIPANLTLTLTIFESNVFWWGWNGDGTPTASTNGLQYHQIVARDILPPVHINTSTSQFDYTTTYQVDERWQKDQLGVVAYLRDEASSEVFQSAVKYPEPAVSKDKELEMLSTRSPVAFFMVFTIIAVFFLARNSRPVLFGNRPSRNS